MYYLATIALGKSTKGRKIKYTIIQYGYTIIQYICNAFNYKYANSPQSCGLDFNPGSVAQDHEVLIFCSIVQTNKRNEEMDKQTNKQMDK